MSKATAPYIAKIDGDLAEIAEERAKLDEREDFLLKAREHYLSNTNGAEHRIVKTKPAKKSRAKARKAPKKRIIPKTKISDFLLNALKGGEMYTKDIANAWATHVKRPVDEIYSSVNNGLNRMKEAGKVDSRDDERGKKYGTKWFLK